MAIRYSRQQCLDRLRAEIARGRGLLMTGAGNGIAANFIDPSTDFLGGGVVEAAPQFRDWFQAKVRDHTALREEQASVTFALVPDLDMAGARGAAIAARETLQTH